MSSEVSNLKGANPDRRCGHRDFDPTRHNTVNECQLDAQSKCVACKEERCSDGWHVYLFFCTLTPGHSPFEANRKFFYWCDKCSGPVCVRCLGIEEDYPCSIDELMAFPFQCPGCSQSVRVVSNSDVTEDGVATLLFQCVANMRCP